MLFYLYNVIHFLRRILFRAFNIKTLGVRALILKDNQILLVRHTYLKGWYLPGGGVNHSESPTQGIIREVREEVGGVVTEPVRLLAVYYNTKLGWDDYVLLYEVKLSSQQGQHDREIAEVRWFNIQQLPEDISPSTRKRIDEHLFNLPVIDHW
jgi:ADP-ribose pyrophosphatase YjhB (NUDIX family)